MGRWHMYIHWNVQIIVFGIFGLVRAKWLWLIYLATQDSAMQREKESIGQEVNTGDLS